MVHTLTFESSSNLELSHIGKPVGYREYLHCTMYSVHKVLSIGTMLSSAYTNNIINKWTEHINYTNTQLKVLLLLKLKWVHAVCSSTLLKMNV